MIWQVVAAVPPGKVATYGQIARQAGMPSHARFVGTTLKNLPQGSRLPWHRIVNAQGKISFPLNSPKYMQQRKLLENEGVEFTGPRVSLKQFGWKP